MGGGSRSRRAREARAPISASRPICSASLRATRRCRCRRVHVAAARSPRHGFHRDRRRRHHASVERHAAELIAALHATPRPFFGYERDTLIGPLPQPNPKSERWVPFFREHRLLAMARAAEAEGALPAKLLVRLERLAERLADYLTEPRHPSLLHGDLWTGNVLVRGNRVAGFVDPAIYYGHPEIELAFTTLFGTFGDRFFEAYETLLPLEPGFHELRRGLVQTLPDARACAAVRRGVYPADRADLVACRIVVLQKKEPARRSRAGLPCETSRTPKALPIRWALARPPFFPKPLCRRSGSLKISRASVFLTLLAKSPPAPPWS